MGALAAAAAAGVAAGYYFYAGKGAKKNRRIAAKWASDMKRDIVIQAKKVRDLDRAQMLALIDAAATTYETVRAVDRKEIARAAKELKNNWQDLAGELSPTLRAAGKRAAASARAGVSSVKKHAKQAHKTIRKTAKKRR